MTWGVIFLLSEVGDEILEGKLVVLGEDSLKNKCYEVNRKDGKQFGCKAVGPLHGVNCACLERTGTELG